MLSSEILESQRRHPLAYASLLFAMLLPMAAGIGGAGFALKQAFPSPSWIEIAAGAIVLVGLIPVLMCSGAGLWLALARRFVPKPIVRLWFVHPGTAIFSRIGRWMFERAYGPETT